MPEMDGLEATNLIRATWPPEHQPRLVALTASALPGDEQQFLQAGLDDYLSKPIQLPALIAALHRCQPLRVQNTSG